MDSCWIYRIIIIHDLTKSFLCCDCIFKCPKNKKLILWCVSVSIVLSGNIWRAYLMIQFMTYHWHTSHRTDDFSVIIFSKYLRKSWLTSSCVESLFVRTSDRESRIVVAMFDYMGDLKLRRSIMFMIRSCSRKRQEMTEKMNSYDKLMISFCTKKDWIS